MKQPLLPLVEKPVAPHWPLTASLPVRSKELIVPLVRGVSQ